MIRNFDTILTSFFSHKCRAVSLSKRFVVLSSSYHIHNKAHSCLSSRVCIVMSSSTYHIHKKARSFLSCSVNRCLKLQTSYLSLSCTPYTQSKPCNTQSSLTLALPAIVNINAQPTLCVRGGSCLPWLTLNLQCLSRSCTWKHSLPLSSVACLALSDSSSIFSASCYCAHQCTACSSRWWWAYSSCPGANTRAG